ncbi:MAG TPA: hypothetical protein VGL24_04890 [Chthoniobacterales bacterium]
MEHLPDLYFDKSEIKNVVFIAGDLHLGAIDDGAHAGFPEMCVAAARCFR